MLIKLSGKAAIKLFATARMMNCYGTDAYTKKREISNSITTEN